MKPTGMAARGLRPIILLALLAMLVPAVVPAQDGGTVTLAPLTCLPQGGNGVVDVTLEPPTGWTSVRVYFRVAGEQDFYYMEMQATSDGGYMAVLPKPGTGTAVVDIMIVAENEAGEEVRSETAEVNVTADCAVALTPEQQQMAGSLVVGNTVAAQEDRTLVGFLCDGVASRVGLDGVIHTDLACRKAQLAAAAGEEEGKKWVVPVILGGAVVGAGAVIHNQGKKPASPSKPGGQ